MYNYLDRDPKNVCVLHCIDGKASSAVVVAALFLYTQLFRTIEEGLQMFAVKRCPPGLNASQYRYLHYYQGLLADPPSFPHHKPVTLATITLSPVPLFTKNRDGCRPYVEIYLGDQRLLSTLGEYERMRVYHATENKVTLQLNTTVCGDVTVIVYHARNTLGGVVQGRPTGLKICQFQIHTGFIPEEETTLRLPRNQLDELTPAEPGTGELYGPNFMVSASFFVLDQDRTVQPEPWGNPFAFFQSGRICVKTPLLSFLNFEGPGDNSPKNAMVLFSSRAEINEVFDTFGMDHHATGAVLKTTPEAAAAPEFIPSQTDNEQHHASAAKPAAPTRPPPPSQPLVEVRSRAGQYTVGYSFNRHDSFVCITAGTQRRLAELELDGKFSKTSQPTHCVGLWRRCAPKPFDPTSNLHKCRRTRRLAARSVSAVQRSSTSRLSSSGPSQQPFLHAGSVRSFGRWLGTSTRHE